ncbi:MAG: hypothetical protein KBD46_00870, partial [Candidatus Levybacteria bacterium]|nr:hypothetical protein [Candidatus Levybacteria bacterium]
MGNTEQWRYSLDLDGTLYTLKPRTGATVEGSVRFRQSEFAYAIKENANRFLQDTLGISEAEAMAEYERIYKKYDGEISLAVEKEYNVDRYTYFNRTWDLDPALFITPEGNVREAITVLN